MIFLGLGGCCLPVLLSAFENGGFNLYDFCFLFPQPTSDLDRAEEIFKKLLKTEGLNPLNVPMYLLKK